MATTASEKKLLIAGDWVETGDWVDVRSPYSGEVVGRVAKAGAAEARRAVDAAEAAMQEPLPAHKRAEILVRVAGHLGRRHEEVAQTIAAEAGKPLKAARVETSRAMSTFTFAAVEARKLAGEMVPMDASQAGAGKLARRFANSLDGAALTARFYDGVPRLPGLMVSEDPRTLESWQFTFQLVGPDRTAWVGSDGKEHSQEALAEFLLKHFLELQQHELGR